MISANSFKITKTQTELFKNLSFDTNPLHCDPVYASCTNFGQPVAYGMSVLIFSLSLWSKGTSFTILNAKIKFNKPIFINKDYILQIDDDLNGKVILEVLKGNVTYCKFHLEYKLNPSLLENQNEITIQNNESKCQYKINDSVIEMFNQEYSLTDLQLPRQLLIFLCWTSYYVGMINPGRQALYSQLNFSTTDKQDLKKIKITSEETHPLFKVVTIQAKAEDSFHEITIKGLIRPESIRYDIEQIKKLKLNYPDLKNKSVLITGANRGLGAVMTKIFALSGANVMAIYKSNDESMLQVANEIKSVNGNISYYKIDLSTNLGYRELSSILNKNGTKLDYVINNAAPSIYPLEFTEQGVDQFYDSFNSFFKIGIHTLNSTLPILNLGGVFINISTSFVNVPVASFTHYIAAKSAMEGLLSSVAIEFPKINFITFRLPKILTDQTNISFSKEKLESPIEKSFEMFNYLFHKRSESINNYTAINLY